MSGGLTGVPTAVDLDELVATSEVPVLVSFGAAWCPPCHALDPVLAEIAEELRGSVDVRRVDVDRVPELTVRWGIASAPTMLLFRGGEPVLRLVGARPKASVLDALAPHL